uniref:Ovule protein n=1 Tax=Mesocestoides corti TaxID=53468 RepID=A0A5K3G0C6_MESCO
MTINSYHTLATTNHPASSLVSRFTRHLRIPTGLTFQRSPGKFSFLLSRLVSQHSTWSISVNHPTRFSFMRRCTQQQQQHKLQRYHQQNDSSPALAQLHEISSGFCQCCKRHAFLSYCS